LAAAVWIILVALVRELSEMVGLILLIVPGVIAVLALWVAIPVCIVERLGVVASIRRSLELTRGQRGQLFLMLIVIWLLVVVFPAFLIGVAAKLIDPLVAAGSFNLGHLSFGLKSAYGNLIYASAYACAYVELRSLKEGVGADSVARVFA
jgi:hypothetical protein